MSTSHNTSHSISELVLTTLRKITRAINLRSRELVKEVGLTVPQMIVLREIARDDLAPMGRVAESVSLSQATVTHIIDRLVARELVERQRGLTDRRKVLLTVTPAGRAVAESGTNILQEDFMESFSTLAEWEQTAILSSLQRVAAMINAERLPADPQVPMDTLPGDTGADH